MDALSLRSELLEQSVLAGFAVNALLVDLGGDLLNHVSKLFGDSELRLLPILLKLGKIQSQLERPLINFFKNQAGAILTSLKA